VCLVMATFSPYVPLETTGKSKAELKGMIPGQGVYFGRPGKMQDFPACVAFGVVALFHIILVIICLAANPLGDVIAKEASDAGCSTVFGVDVNDVATVANELDAQVQALEPGITLLIQEFLGVFIGSICMLLALCVIWVFIIRYAAQVVVWGTLIFKALLFSVFAVYLLTDPILSLLFSEQPGIPIILILYSLLSFVLMFFARAKIATAAEVMRAAMKGIIANPLLLLVALVLEVIVIFYQLMVVLSVLLSVRLVTAIPNPLDPSNCFIESSGFAEFARTANIFFMIWIMSWFDAIRLFVVAVAIGDWYFPHQQADPNRKVPVVQALTWAFTTNAGTLAIATIPILIAKWAKKKARQNVFKVFCNPCGCIGIILWCLAKVLATLLRLLSSTIVVLSALTGGDVCAVMKIGEGLVERHLMNGLVTNVVAENVLDMGATILSILGGMFCWGLVAGNQEKGFFEDTQNGVLSEFGAQLFGIFLIVYLFVIVYLLVNRWIGLILFTLFPEALLEQFFGPAGALGIYVMILGRFLFPFMASFMLDATDATFLCFAIDQDNGGLSPETQIIGPYVEVLAKSAIDEANGALPWAKAENAEGWENGVKVNVTGLESAQGQPYNGTSGVIQNYNKKADRYDVLMFDGKVVGLKLANMSKGPVGLVAASATPAASAPAPETTSNPAGTSDSKLLACSSCQGSFMTPPNAVSGSLMACPHCQTQLAVP